MTETYQWISPHQIYPDRPNKSYRLKRFRYQLRSWLNAKSIQQFTEFVNQHPTLIPELNQRMDYSYPLVYRFLDKRFNARQRFEAMCDNLLFVNEILAKRGLPSLWQQPISFGEIIEGFELRLMASDHQPMEGFWVLELIRIEDQEVIYLLTFGKIPEGLLIGVIQGPNIDGSKELVKKLTKQCHGLRPAYLMIEIMKFLTQALGYQTLLGIPQQHQNKSRFIQSKKYVVDYDAMFRESGGVKKAYWHLPLTVEQKPLETIASNKRSMYKKRYAMLEEIRQKMWETLGYSAEN